MVTKEEISIFVAWYPWDIRRAANESATDPYTWICPTKTGEAQSSSRAARPGAESESSQTAGRKEPSERTSRRRRVADCAIRA